MRNMKKWILGILFALLAAVMLQEPAGAYAEGEDINYFCIENVSGVDATVTWERICNLHENVAMDIGEYIRLYYSYDKEAWEGPLNFEIGSVDISLPAGGKVYFKNAVGHFSSDSKELEECYTVGCDQAYNVSGDITTLLNGSGNVTDLTNAGCYAFAKLFKESTNLISAEGLLLPATTLAEGCYRSMFEGCTSLEEAPALPATTLKKNCYRNMFKGCASLEAAPALPATTLAEDCYGMMFYQCTSLEEAPALPATTLKDRCYYMMFEGCTSLKAAPALPATKLTEACYSRMFYDCNSLSDIQLYATDISAQYCLDRLAENVSSTGTFYKSGALLMENIESGNSCIPTGWTVYDIEDCKRISVTEGIENGTVSTSLSLAPKGVQVDVTVEPNRGWAFKSLIVKDSSENEISVTDGKFIMPASDVTVTAEFEKAVNSEGEDINYFCIENVSGQGATVTWKYNGYYEGLENPSIIKLYYSYDKEKWVGPLNFENDSDVDISLPVTKRKVYFKNDTGHFNNDSAAYDYYTVECNQYYNVSGDITTLLNVSGNVTDLSTAGKCVFDSLFYSSEKLKSAENLVLPSTTLTDYCYYGMFHDCISLEEAPALPATTLAEKCYCEMFRGCTSLEAAPALPATTLKSYCYGSMFSDCTSLEAAPALPATTLAGSCYLGMFSGCTSLNNIEFYATDISASFCLIDWTKGVSSTGTFYKSRALSMETIESGNSGIPAGWTVYDIEDCKRISVTEGIENGTVSTSLSFAPEGAQVDVTVEPNRGWAFKSLIVKDSSENEISVTDGKFIMPASAVTVTAEFEKAVNSEGEDINYFCIENVSGQGATVTWKYNGYYEGLENPSIIKLYYSYDKEEWTGPLNFENDSAVNISLPVTKRKVYFKNDTGHFNNDSEGYDYYTVECDQYYNVSGDITTLLNVSGNVTDLSTAGKCVFDSLFYSSENLKSAENLVLPSTTLTVGCYWRMFRDCTSLEAAPALPATTLAEDCYGEMFYRCTSLETAPALPSTTLEDYCYEYMFRGCASLEAAPALPATTLVEGCYLNMFEGCTSLNNIQLYATDISADGCLANWTSDVSPTGTFYKSRLLTEPISSGSDGIHTGWTVFNIEDYGKSISVTEGIENGTVSTSLSLALEGVQVCVTAEPNEGYVLKSLIVKDSSGNEITVTDGKFTMPASAVTVSAEFEKVLYVVNVIDDGLGTVEADKYEAYFGDTVTLSVKPNTGYVFESLYSDDVTIIDKSFTMPAKDVTVYAKFGEAIYSVNVITDGNGIASADNTVELAGTDVTLTATANAGYHFKEWQSEDVTIIGNSFTMPAKDVTIKAVFEKNQVITPSPDPKPSGDSGQGGNAGGSTVPSNSGTSGGTEQTGDNGNLADTGKTETEGTSEDTGKTEDTDKTDNSDITDSTDKTDNTDNTDSKLPEGVQKVIGEMDDSKKGSKAAKLLEEIFAEENGQGASDDGTAGSEQETSGETASEQEDSQQKVTVSVVMTENSADEVQSGSFKGGVFKNSEGKTVKNSIVESENNGKKYFVNEKGRKVRNAIVTDGANLYYCNKYGTMVTNKAVDLGDGRTVLAGEDGIIITKSDARVSVGGKSYITGENGIVVKDAITTISVKVKKNGKKVTVERNYITDENGVIQTGLVEHDGKFYITSKTGIVRKNRITTINGVKMYTDENGEVVKNATVKYGKVTYQADENGALTRVKKQENKKQENKKQKK